MCKFISDADLGSTANNFLAGEFSAIFFIVTG